MAVVAGLPFNDEKMEYIIKILDPLMEDMVIDVLNDMPKSPIDYMIQWLEKRSGSNASERRATAPGLLEQNRLLKQELSKLTQSLGDVGQCISHEEAGAGEEDEEASDEEESDDDCDEIPESFRQSEAQKGRARQSVSAEAYGKWNQKKAFTPPVYPKSEEQMQRLKQVLCNSFMFNSLEAADMETILLAVKEIEFVKGTKIINEGDDGNCLFVIEKGVLQCFKKLNGLETLVKTCYPGDVFGELALLYNCPRAATCIAHEDLVAWQLDRETFNEILMEAASRKRNKYDEFLKSVAIISSIGAYERSQIADALKSETYTAGEFVVRQDDAGHAFYIVEEGRLYASKFIPGEGERRLMEYKAGDCFGELALLRNQPRAASVVVESGSAKLLSLSRNAFKKMLGPLQDLMAKHTQQYSM